MGQIDKHLRFLSHTDRYALFVAQNELVLVLESQTASNGRKGHPSVLRVRLAGSNQSARVEGLDPAPTRVNYFVGEDPDNWHTDVPTFRRVRYAGIYPGGDLVVETDSRGLELRFDLSDRADPRAIRLRAEGTASAALDPDGDLVVHGAEGGFRFARPRVYRNNRETADSVKYVLASSGVVSAEAKSEDDAASAGTPEISTALPNVVTNPQLVYSTYLGGTATLTGTTATGADRGFGVATDQQGRIYVAGYSRSFDFPVPRERFKPLTTARPTRSKTLSYRFSTLLPRPLTSWFIQLTWAGAAVRKDLRGTSSIGDAALRLRTDSQGLIYVTGYTKSPDFPVTPGAFQKTNRAYAKKFSTVFVSVLNPQAPAD